MEQIIQLNSQAKLSEHLASPSEAALSNLSELNCVRLSPHFTLGEFTKSGSHPEVYNIPSHEAIENLKRLCGWLEELRKRYNERYVVNIIPPKLGGNQRGLRSALPLGSSKNERLNNPLLRPPLAPPTSGGEINTPEPIRINSGYRSAQLNKKIGGAANSNHLTGCACDIKVSGMEQALRYAVILLDYSQESHQEFDELLIEKNRYGAIWVHFAVRPSNNRRKVAFLRA